MNIYTVTKIATFAIAIPLLQACGGAADSSATGGLAEGECATQPHTIVISSPYTNAIQNKGGGIYKFIATATVTDCEGNAVPDGTRINLNVIDTIIAEGTINAADNDSISGTTLIDINPLKGNSTDATAFDTASVTRNDKQRFIKPGDHVLLFNADEADKIRTVVSVNGATSITVDRPYHNNYPNAVYDESAVFKTTGYVIGASLNGAKVRGVDANGNEVENYSVTKEGKATFYMEYPADALTILNGCYNDYLPPYYADRPSTPIDTRYEPLGSSHSIMIAHVNDNVTAVDASHFCFKFIAPPELTALPNSDIVDGSIVTVKVVDGGDKIPLPFVRVGYVGGGTAGSSASPVPPATELRTNAFGEVSAVISVSGNSGDSGTGTFIYGDGSVVISTKVP